MPDEIEDHDRGLSHDLPRILAGHARLGRRGMFAALGAAGVAAVGAGCASDDTGTTLGVATPRPAPTADEVIPEEIAGPYPGDGSNGVNVLRESGIVRRDITPSFGASSGTAAGIPVTVRLRIYDLSGDAVAPLAGAALYLWQCDREANYSMYSEAAKDQNYLRGVQVADDDGWVEFASIFPGCYAGRWPHLHFEIYPSIEDATSYRHKLRTSQLALPRAVCREVYATAGYEASVANLAAISLASDMVFADGHSLQMAKVTGSVDDGYTITLNVPV